MKRRQSKKLWNRYTGNERRRIYAYRGVDENGYLVILGFTCKPKQEGCESYGIKYISDMLYFHGRASYRMLSPINTHYANKYYSKKL